MNGKAAIAFAHSCRDAAPMFLEEPVWPPEDFATLAEVRTKGGLDVAAGENACTAHQFREMMKAGAVSHAQPSVIKVGGITEYLKVVALADEFGIRLAPHSPYFGPGFLATLQLMSLRDDATFVEVFYMKRAACLWRGRIDVDANGDIEVPAGTGPRLRAGRGGHGAIPGVLIWAAATSNRPLPARHPSRPAQQASSRRQPPCSAPSATRATIFCSAATALFSASICRLAASTFC